jgi:hypothetical protein
LTNPAFAAFRSPKARTTPIYDEVRPEDFTSDTNIEPERYFSGEDELSALLLLMVMDHCAGYSWEDEQAGL